MPDSKTPQGKSLQSCLVTLRKVAIFTLICGSVASTSLLPAQGPGPRRLSVRPHEMATATKTAQAGEFPLDSNPRGLVYVPKQAVGTKRVPLVVSLTGGGVNAKGEMDLIRSLADKYGMILLVLDHPSAVVFDAALKQVLAKFAIDPDRISVGGVSEGGAMSLEFGRNNLDVFSRFAPMSANFNNPYTGTETSNAKTQAFVSAGIGEPSDMVGDLINIAREEREKGRVVKSVLNLRLHANRMEDHDYMWQWLRDSWSKSDKGVSASVSPADDIVLTSDILEKMSKFWTQLKNDKDSSRAINFRAYQKELSLLMGEERVFAYDMIDMPKIVSKNSWVGSVLKNAGLTQKQEENYRRAFIGARATKVAAGAIGKLPEKSVMAQNLVFLNAHEEKVNALLDLMGIPRCETTIQMQFGC